jgi:hypothetical protein
MEQPVVHNGSIRDTMAIILSPLLGELLPANRINRQAGAM